MHNSKIFDRIGPIAHNFPSGGAKGRRAKDIKEKLRYMRIIRPRRKEERQKSKIAPAAWQEFIEI